MKKSILFIGTFVLAFGAIAFFASFEDANQAKIDAKYDELKSKWMDEKWGECLATVMADAQSEYDEFAAANAPEEGENKTVTTRTTKPTTGGGSTTTTTTTTTTGGGAEETTTTVTKDPKGSKISGETTTDKKDSKMSGDTKTTTDDKKKKMGGGK